MDARGRAKSTSCQPIESLASATAATTTPQPRAALSLLPLPRPPNTSSILGVWLQLRCHGLPVRLRSEGRQQKAAHAPELLRVPARERLPVRPHLPLQPTARAPADMPRMASADGEQPPSSSRRMRMRPAHWRSARVHYPNLNPTRRKSPCLACRLGAFAAPGTRPGDR